MQQSIRARVLAPLPWLLAIGAATTAHGQRGGGGGAGPQATQPVGTARFEYLGPRSDGRIAAATGVQGKPGVYYAGAASGGVWKSIDAAQTWKPVFDAQPVQAIGSLAVAPTDPNIVWAGTGEGWAVRDMDVLGDGIYKSTDAGETWTNMGLRNTGRIGTIAVHPTNPNIVFACTLGTTHAPQQERGLYRTTDGGRNWTRVLFVNDKTGCSGVSISQKDPNIVIAGTWEIEMYTWVLLSGGPGSGVHISRDGGATFTRVTQGLPELPYGKVDVSIAPSDGNRMYALIQTGADGVKGLASKAQGSLWRSDNGGQSWYVQSWDRRLIGRAGYYIRIRVSPDDPNLVLVANSTLWVTRDGGKTFTGGSGCGDCHDVWWDPTPGMRSAPNASIAGHYIVTGDAGMTVYGASTSPAQLVQTDSNRTEARQVAVTLPIGQMYHVGIDDRTPYWVYSDRQDDGSMRISSAVGLVNANVILPNVPAVTPDVLAAGGGRGAGAPPGGAAGGGRGAGGGGRGGAGAPPAGGAGGGRGGGGRGGAGGGGGAAYQEEGMPSCESGQLAPVPGNANIVFGSCYGDQVSVRDVAAGTTRSISPWMHTLDHDPVGLKYRCHWAPPLAADPFERGTVYFGCQVIFRTRNMGQSWDVISPDLSTRDPKRVAFSGGVVGDNLGQFYGEVVSAIYPSRVQRGLMWAGTNDGKLWVTRNSGAPVPTWVDVGKNITGLREWGVIRKIEPSTFNAGTAYASFDYHLMGHGDPYVYKTTDFGLTWKRISDGLPKGHPLDYVMSVAENPNRKGMIFAGTGHGFYYSLNDGATWTQYKDGLPAAPVTGIEVSKMMPEIAVSTYGRGLYILRDIWKLEGPVAPAAGQQGGGDLLLYTPRPGLRTAGGGTANFVFELASAPTGPITMEVLDTAGTVLNTSQVTGRAGMNRASWNMLYPSANRPVLRALPEDNPNIYDGNRFPGGTRQVTHWGLGGATWQPRAAPGKYQVRFTYNGKKYTQPFEVVADPSMPSTAADLVAGTRFQQKIIAAMNETVDRINRLEILRKQVEDLRKQHGADATLDKALADIGSAMYKTEMHFLSRTDLHSDDKWYVEKYKLYMNLTWLLSEVGGGGGDVSGGVGFKPTDAAVATLAEQTRLLTIAKLDFDQLMTRVATFNKTYAGKLTPLSDKLPGSGTGGP